MNSNRQDRLVKRLSRKLGPDFEVAIHTIWNPELDSFVEILVVSHGEQAFALQAKYRETGYVDEVVRQAIGLLCENIL